MHSVIQLTRRLADRPAIPEVPGVRLRHYAGVEDAQRWLELRRRAFARQRVGVDDWQAEDFIREFLDKRWWNPQRMWFAETQSWMMPTKVVGTVTLARRGEAPNDKPVVHWLVVLPGYRKQGIGRLLMATVEATAWDAGGRQVWLETHAAWREALGLYQSLGYEPATP